MYRRQAVMLVYEALEECPAVGHVSKTIGVDDLGRLYRYWSRLQRGAMMLLLEAIVGPRNEVEELAGEFRELLSATRAEITALQRTTDGTSADPHQDE